MARISRSVRSAKFFNAMLEAFRERAPSSLRLETHAARAKYRDVGLWKFPVFSKNRESDSFP
jgi:hypothetical protein